ncbi:histidine phosphatase family protein [Undibacterium sp. Di24W]|uniref:histidine phosphatase family protein n=1 Tax=Undibacterium sp. Di24W TaxID=3413033 RepID=UPI003BF28EB3
MAGQTRRLWLVRHAQPLIAGGICYGRLDVPAEPEATQQAAKSFAKTLAETLAQARENSVLSLNTKSIHIYVSGLQRAQQLADELCLALNNVKDLSQVLRQTDRRLNEMDFGIWEAKAWSDIPETAVEHWSADFAQHKFGGKESSQDVIDRVLAAYQATLEQAQISHSSDVIWITHAGVIRALNYLHKHGIHPIARAEQWPREAPGFGQWQCLDLMSLQAKN